MNFHFLSRLILALLFNLLAIALFVRFDEWLMLLDNEWIYQHRSHVNDVVYSMMFFSLAHLFAVLFRKVLTKRPNGKQIPGLLQDLIIFLIYFVTVAAICGFVLNLSMAGFWTSTSAFGVVFGFALRNVILDTFMGLALSVENEFKVGDYLILHDRSTQAKENIIGQVIETNWRSTRLVMDGKQITIPNSVMGSKIVTNLSRPSLESEFELLVNIDFSVESEHALRVLMAGVKSALIVPGILDKPEPRVRIRGTTELGVEYKIKYTIMPTKIGPGKARHFVLKHVLEHLHYAGITLAYPKQDAYHTKMPPRQLDLNSVEDRIKILSRIYLFQSLETETINKLASLMHLKHFHENDILIQQHDEGDSMYILVEGLLYVYIEQDSSAPALKVGQITPGKFFGEMSLLTGETRSATIKAMTHTVVYQITRDHVNSILMTNPQIAEILSLAVAQHRVSISDIKEMQIEEKTEQTSNIAQQILDKMRSFFNYSHSVPVVSLKKKP